MKITTWRVTEIAQIEVDENSFSVDRVKIDQILESLHKQGEVALHAGAENARELESPEELVEFLLTAGITPEVEYNPVTGLIDSIHASGSHSLFEYDPAEAAEVLESLQANGPTPAKLIGDLAQTSVGLTGAETQVLGLNEWTIDWKRKTADATTTDDDTYESSLGSTASWSVKAKYMFIDGDTSQMTYIYNTITSPQNPQPWNFFPTIAMGRTCFSGLAYVDGLTIASGMGKVVATDVSLKGTGPLKVGTQIAPAANPNTGTGQTAES